MMRKSVVLFGLLLMACSPDAAPTESAAETPAYTSPPVALGVQARGSDDLVIEGRAGPDERVRVIQMDGTAHGVTADAQGAFAISVPGGTRADRLFNLSVDRSGQSVSSDGWLFSSGAAPERAVMLRVGGASLPVGPAPLLAVVDMDGGGGVAVSGLAEPGVTVSVAVDGERRGSVTASADGRWSLVLTSMLAQGPHQLTASAGERRDSRDVVLVSQTPSAALESASVDGAIRVAWLLPGGGSQTTWILLP